MSEPEPTVTVSVTIPVAQLLSLETLERDDDGYSAVTVAELVARSIIDHDRRTGSSDLYALIGAEIKQAVRKRIRLALASPPAADDSIGSLIMDAARSQLHGNGGTSTPITAWIGGEVMRRLIGLDATKDVLDEFDRVVQRHRKAHGR